jgi:curved DNA-binding protein CbpA
MTDCFALLSEPRRPWLDTDALKARFLPLSTEVHPDRFHNASASDKQQANDRYVALNSAYNTLREPKDRLRHLLELELGTPPANIQTIPAGTMKLSFAVGQVCREADGLIKEKDKASSPLLKVKLFERGMEITDKLAALQQQINQRRDRLTAELQAMNAQWEQAEGMSAERRRAALPLGRLEEIYREFSFITRWTGQIQERIVRLAM